MTKKQLLFSLKGRINRKKYWQGQLLAITIAAFPVILFGAFFFIDIATAIGIPSAIEAITGDMEKAISQSTNSNPVFYIESDAFYIINILVTAPLLLIGLYATIAVSIKRLHDLNLSGWWWIIIAVFSAILGEVIFLKIIASVIGWTLFVAIGLIKGTSGTNKYGEATLS